MYLVTEKNTNKKYALKIIDMSKLCVDDYENIIKEITSQLKMNHPNIIKLYDFYVNGQMIYML